MNCPEAERIAVELDRLNQEVRAQRDVLLAEHRELGRLYDLRMGSRDALLMKPKSEELQRAHDANIKALETARSRVVAVERTIQQLCIDYMNLSRQQRDAVRLSAIQPEVYQP